LHIRKDYLSGYEEVDEDVRNIVYEPVVAARVQEIRISSVLGAIPGLKV
jgi:hypothetical protein